MELVVKYGLDPVEINNAKCFKGNNTYRVAMDHLIDVTSSGLPLDDIKPEVKKAFDKIKDLDRPEEIELVGKYGLDPNEVKNAEFLKQSGASASKALESIRKAYESGAYLNERKARAKEAFNIIVSTDELVGKYGFTLTKVKDAKCLRNDACDKSMECIKQAYENGANPQDSKAKAIEVFDKIKDLDSPYKIELVVKYGLDHNARCLIYAPAKAMECIKQAYESGANPQDSKAKAIEVFDKIKDLDHPGKVELVGKYGFEPAEVKDAQCFRYFTAEKSLEYIREAYENGANPQDSKAKAKEVFDKIKDLNSSEKIELVVKYGLDPDKVKNCKNIDNKYSSGEAGLSIIMRSY
jgi:hypothetical protein